MLAKVSGLWESQEVFWSTVIIFGLAEYCTKENEVISYYFVFFIVCRLQILTCLFSKHISSLPASEFCHFFLVLHQIQTKQKRL